MGRLLRGEALLAGGVIALGLFVAVETLSISAPAGYSRVGPAAYPWAVAVALIATGAWLLWDAVAGTWRGERGQAGAPAFDGRAFAYVSLGLILHMLLISTAGFVLASAVLFVCVARAFGGRNLLLSAAIGLGLALAAYVGFDRGLDLDLPGGLLEGIL